MQKDLLTNEMLLKKADEIELPFAKLLGGAVLEEVVRRISESEYGGNLWLRNGKILGREQYAKNLSLDLVYDFISSDLKGQELATELRETVFEGNEDYGIVFSQKEKVQKKYLLLLLEAKVEDMQVPISIKIYHPHDNHRASMEKTFSCMLFPQTAVSYRCYLPEDILVEHYMEIITKLELILSPEAYYDIYCLLGQESIDGRKVKEDIEEQCARLGIAKEKERLAIIAGYKNYSYMKKKWKAFLRSINSKEPSWELVLERFLKFFDPIWDAVVEDFVFFDSWMPELCRFL